MGWNLALIKRELDEAKKKYQVYEEKCKEQNLNPLDFETWSAIQRRYAWEEGIRRAIEGAGDIAIDKGDRLIWIFTKKKNKSEGSEEAKEGEARQR
jgi:hypothetical protein